MKATSFWRVSCIGITALILLACSMFGGNEIEKSLQSTIDAMSTQMQRSETIPPGEAHLGTQEVEEQTTSPDSYIAFVAGNAPDASVVSQNLVLVRPDGTGLVNLNGASTWNDSPTWSPDGTCLAFWSEKDGNRDIYVLDLKSQTVERLTDDPEWDINPSWSPDGTKIAFASGRGGNMNIYLMNADGSQQEALTSGELDKNYPSWSPDGKRLAFLKVLTNEMMIIQSDGRDETSVGIATGRAAWSPDGKRLAYAGFYDSSAPEWIQTNNPNIMVYDFETDEHIRLTDNPGVDAFPSWSPDGTRLVFESDKDDPLTYTRSLYLIELKGPIENFEKSWVSRLTSGEGMKATWSPANLSTVTPPPVIQQVPPPTIRVCPSGCDYSSIQQAIDATKGATIVQVESGTYTEKLEVNNSVRLHGVDTGGGQPVIDAAGEVEVVSIVSTGVTFEGFQFINPGYTYESGIIYVTSSHNTIIGNTIVCARQNDSNFIFLDHSDFNALRENSDLGGCGSIFVKGSYNQVTGSQIGGRIIVTSGQDYNMPIHHLYARFNLVADNIALDILLDHEVAESRIVDNVISRSGATSTGDTESEIGGPGFTVGQMPQGGRILLNCGPTLNVVAANQIVNESGIQLTSANSYNMILNNRITGGDNGITLERSAWELVYGNQVSNNAGYGIYTGTALELSEAEALVFGTGGGHVIYKNTLLDNAINAYDDWHSTPSGMPTLWDDGMFGNYYSNYDEASEGCLDADGDRICDTPYSIPPGLPDEIDNYPLMDQTIE